MLTFSLLVLSSLSSVRSEGSACPGEDHPLVHSQYSYEASCSNQHIGEALRANVGCRLVETVVELPWPNNTLVQQMTPTHILVSRCAGSCHGQGQTCLPTEQSKRKVEVMLGINEEKLEVYPKDGYEASAATSSSGTGRIGMSFTVAS